MSLFVEIFILITALEKGSNDNIMLSSPQNNYHYNPKLKDYANKLRKRMTKAEACIWKYLLKAREMKGYQFRRQRPVLNYIADFMCKELLLIIEIDGSFHDLEEVQLKDEARTKELEKVGFTVLRFSNWEVLNRMPDVSIVIAEWIDANAKVPPPPRRRRSRDKTEESVE